LNDRKNNHRVLADPLGRRPLRTQKVERRTLVDHRSQEYFVYVPSNGGRGAPILAVVHGISRNAHEQVEMFQSHAESLGVVVVAPHFDTDAHPDYQRLGRAGRGARADLVFDAIVDEAAWLTGASARKISLFGVSGGAQFVHRYIMANSERVAGAVVVAAGWYTLPAPRRRFPYGIRPCDALPGVHFDPEEFLRVPITVMVGSEDTAADGLRQTRRALQQGANRVERARTWVRAMHEAAAAYGLQPRVTLQEIPGGGHAFSDLVQRHRLADRVASALYGAAPSPARGKRHVSP